MSRPALKREYPKEIHWLLKYKPILSFHKIEKELEMPPCTLSKLSLGTAGVNEQYWPRLIKFVQKIINKDFFQ